MSLRSFLFAGLVLWSWASPAAQISIPNSVAQAGAGFIVEVQLAGQGNLVTGLQFDLECDPTLVITAAGGAVATSSGKTLSMGDLASGAKRYLVVGLNQNAMPDGVVLSLGIVTPAASTGTQYVLHVSNSQATNENGAAVLLSTVDGVVSVDNPPAKITAVVGGASFLPGIVDGSWISILGSNLSTNTRSWRPDEIADGKLPTALDDVTVTVNGLPAAISYISPTQLNVQVPATGRIGAVDVIATSLAGGSTAASAVITRNSPGLFVYAQAGGKYPAAFIARNDGGLDYLGPTGLFGTAPATRPANPGEVIELYATGLGPTNPVVPAGQVFSGAAAIVDPVVVTIGGVNAAVAFAGITSAGLYQVNVTVPNVASGNQPLIVSVNGVSSQPGVFVAVGHT